MGNTAPLNTPNTLPLNVFAMKFYAYPYQIILLCSVVFFCNALSAQKTIYFANGPMGVQTFALDTTRILVAFKPQATPAERTTIVERISKALTYSTDLEFPQFGATVLMLKPGIKQEQVAAMLQDMNRQGSFQYAAPFLRYEDGALCGILNEINVGLQQPGDVQWLQSFCREQQLEQPVCNAFDALFFSIKVPDNQMGRAFDIANMLYNTGKTAFAEVNFMRIMRPFNTNDPLRSTQWSQQNTGKYWNGFNWVNVGVNDADMDVTEAWSITTGSASVKVAVIDDGVNTTHPDLAGNMLSGYDATGGGSGGNPSGNDAHGTSCAGIIAARGNNNLGLAGNAYTCKIIPVRIAYTPTGQTVWHTFDTWCANGINWAWQTAGASVLSNSWGGGPSSAAVNSAISNATTNGRSGKGAPVLFATANGNISTVSFPARYESAIAVGASSMCDTRKSFVSCDGEASWGSNYGTGIDIVAPGVKITTTDIAGPAGYSNGDYSYTFNGTSSACPNAASVVALILSANPNLTGAQARAILENTCEKVGGYNYATNSSQPNGTWNFEMGYGRVNARAACLAAQVPTCATPSTAQLSATNISNTTARLNCSVSGVQAYDWAYRQVGASSWTDVAGTTVNYVNITGLTSNKQYEFVAAVRCNSSTWSSWSSTATFTTTGSGNTTPPNNLPCSALSLTAGSSCWYMNSTTVGATASSSGTTCGTSSPKDVWFKCPIPSSGLVTFRTSAGSLTDAVMAVYWGSTCSSLNYIACEDDNANGNGSQMPVIGITGQPGTMLWVRVWGYNNALGSFGICAINYNSSNFAGGGDDMLAGPVYAIDYNQQSVYQAPNAPEFIEAAELNPADRNAEEKVSATRIGNLYPNPAQSVVLLPYTLALRGTVQIAVCDMLGRVLKQQLFEQEMGDHQATIDLNGMAQGAYSVRFQSNDLNAVQVLQVLR